MKITNAVYVPVELDWSAAESYIAQYESYTGEQLKYFPAGNPVTAAGLFDAPNAIGVLPENLWIVPDRPVIKAVNVLVFGDVILDVDSTGAGPEASMYQAAAGGYLPASIRFYTRAGNAILS